MTATTEPSDSTLSAPSASEVIARLFSSGETPAVIDHAKNLLGEENFILLADYVATIDGVSRESLLGNFCESWTGDMVALKSSIALLAQLPATTVLRAVMALQIGRRSPNLIAAMLPFYRGIAGFQS